MAIQKKPYLIIPVLVEQPTWGGEYICKKKGWLYKQGLKNKKIGQSYELSNTSFLAPSIFSSDNPHFSPEMKNSLSISVFSEKRPFPLIKFTQAKGNSFQLHVKPEVENTSWQPKAESWYFLENGKITLGVKKGIHINTYKQTCILIESEMKKLSKMILNQSLTREQANKKAKLFILENNPWQFVNTYETKKGEVVDLSRGGLHHSWEEDVANYPQGNIVYEIQQDVMDSVSTLRSFDQGKFKEDGTIREIQIDDYFDHIDTDETNNILVPEKKQGDILFDTPFYSLISQMLLSNKEMESTTSFHHLFVKEGTIIISDQNNNEISVGMGHSCFIPMGIKYLIKPIEKSEILLTYLR